MSSQTVDFQQIKQAATAEIVIRLLGLTVKAHGDTWRGACHLCKATDQRALVITASKKLFHCFKCKEGGDMLKLVAVSKNIPVRDAAIELAKICGVSLAPAEDRKPIASTQQNAERKGFDAEKYAAGLDPSHTALEPLGVSPETYRSWKAGYSPAGVNRGRLALPVAARDGTIVGYCGRGVTSDQQPNLIFPNGLTPTDHIFGADRVKAGELILVRDPVDVLTAYENGIENVVSFLTESVSSAQLQYLSALMDEAHVETLVLF